jgi:hypothetical protein
MRETTLDDVIQSIETLTDAVTQMSRDVCTALASVEAAVWDTMPT